VSHKTTEYTIKDLSPFTTYHVNVSAIPEDRSYRPPAKITVTTQVYYIVAAAAVSPSTAVDNDVVVSGAEVLDSPGTSAATAVIAVVAVVAAAASTAAPTSVPAPTYAFAHAPAAFPAPNFLHQMAAPQPMVRPDFFGVKKDMGGVITVYLPQVQKLTKIKK
jgi:hypothetical protein